MYHTWRVKTPGDTPTFRMMYLIYPIMHASLNFPTLTAPSLAATIMNQGPDGSRRVYSLDCVNYIHFHRELVCPFRPRSRPTL